MTRHPELTQSDSKRCEHETEDGAAPEIKSEGENELPLKFEGIDL